MGQADICLFLHDLEKPFRYGPKDHPDVAKWHLFMERHKDEDHSEQFGFPPEENWKLWEKVKWVIITDSMTRFDFMITEDEFNALKYTHGEGHDHRKDRRIQGPLAAHVHHCDNTSARIWFDDGKGFG